MNPRSFPFPLLHLSLGFMLLLLLNSLLASSAYGQWFLHCNHGSYCESYNRTEFPLWLHEGTGSCGHLQTTKLNCKGSRTTIQVFGAQYELLGFSTNDQILLVAGDFFSYEFCSHDIWSFIYGVIPLSYDCLQPQSQDKAACSETTVTYLPSNTAANSDAYCMQSAVVPISPILLTKLGDLQKVLQHIITELKTQAKVDAQVCKSCSICGYDLHSKRTRCYCQSPFNGFEVCASNSSSSEEEHPPTGSGRLNLFKKILIIEVALASGWIILIISLIIFIRYPRKSISNKPEIEEVIRSYSTQTPKRYSYSRLKKITDAFKNKLGQGGSSIVYKGKLPDGRDVAVKLLNESKKNGQDFINEVVNIGRTSHINIVTLLGFCYEGNKRALIYEYMPKGSLDKYISPKGSHKLDLNTLHNIAIGIARGLEYLHRGCNTKILHFDIKPHNILLDNEFCPKISDFGLAKQCRGGESYVSMTGMKGTAGFMAPEVIFRSFGRVTNKSDAYSFGMLILEMMGERRNPKEGEEQSSEEYFPDWIYKDLTESEMDGGNSNTEDEENIGRKMIIVGLCCIQTLPNDRPSMTDVVAMLEGSVDGLQIPSKPTLFGFGASSSAMSL